MKRRPLIAGNWKLNLNPEEASILAQQLNDNLSHRGEVEVAVFPTTISLTTVIVETSGSGIHVGIQNVFTEPLGAYTGANSAKMARSAGCSHALVGHSERRHIFGETNAQTGLKVRAAREAGLLPVLCVGETLQEREGGLAERNVIDQLNAGLEHIEADQMSGLVIAYEPVWAIGTGVVASPIQAQEMHACIRTWLGDRYPPFVREETKILYGGSVKPGNANELLTCADIDGALVGGASLKAESFAKIVSIASEL